MEQKISGTERSRIEHESLWFIDENQWDLNLGDTLIASDKTLDLQPIQKKWAVIPARACLHVWEKWAKKNAPEYLDVPRKCLEIAENESFDARLAQDCLDAACFDLTRGTAYNAALASYHAIHNYNYTRQGSRFAASASTRALSYSIGYQEWCLKFTSQVFSILKEQNR